MNKRIFAVFAFATVLALSAIPARAVDPSELEGLIFVKTNQVRTARGLPALQWDSKARDAARGHSEEMARLGYGSHYSPTPGLGTPSERVLRARISAVSNNENWFQVAVSGLTAEELAERAVAWWMNSPGHRANILSAQYTHMGVGGGRGQYEGRDTIFLTQTFLSRSVLDPRLTLDRSEAENLKMRIEGRNISGAPLAVVWKERGEIKFADVTNGNGSFTQTFLLPKSLGDVEIFLGKKTAPTSVEVTDRFLVNTTRQSIEPPPY